MRSSLLNPILLSLLLAAGVASSDGDSAPFSPSNGTTVYDLLPHFGLPSGLLPSTVTSFSLAENGYFEVNLSNECYIEFDYLVYYAPKITGVIRYGEIDQLEGIQARRFLIWFNVDAIKVDLPPSYFIYFDIGLITRKLQVKQFQSVRSCQKRLAEDPMEQGVVGLYQRMLGTVLAFLALQRRQTIIDLFNGVLLNHEMI